jgi:hypothetical protein
MWETTTFHVLLSKGRKKVKVRGIPHLAKNERDMGHPMLCGREKASTRHSNSVAELNFERSGSQTSIEVKLAMLIRDTLS